MKLTPGSRTRRTVLTAGLWVTSIVVAASGTAFATAQITSSQIQDDTVTSVDLKNGGVGYVDISRGAKLNLIKAARSGIAAQGGGASGAAGANGLNGAAGAKGEAGAAGKDGAKGDKGDKGAQGDQGLVVVANETTPAGDAAHQNQHVVTVERVDPNGAVSSPSNASPGTKLVGVTLDKGTYLVSGTAQFLSLQSYVGNNSQVDDFGAVGLFVDGAQYGSVLFSGDIPTNSNNLAQTNATTVVTITKDDTDVTLRAVARGGVEAGGQSLTWGGGNLLVSRVTSEL